jgi:Flp pilus assembly protein TadD
MIFQKYKPAWCLISLFAWMTVAGSFVQVEGQTTESDLRVGKKIIVTKAGAELKTPEATVWRAYPGEVFTISLVNGEWLWIRERSGWMWENDGVLFEKAISVTSDRLSKNPTAEAYNIRGVVFLAHENYDRALKDFSASLVRSPRNPGVLNNRGQCHYLKKDYVQAIADFSEALELNPKHFVALNNRALVHIELKQYDQARKDIQEALKLNPKYPEALLNRGVVNEETGKSKQAIADYTAAIEIDKAYAGAYGNRAFSYRTAGMYTKAIEDLRTAIKLDPENFEPVNDLAYTLATAKDDSVRNGAEALALAEQANSMSGEEHWNALDTLAVASAEVNDFDSAATAVACALELAPEDKREKVLAHQELIASQKPIRE